VNNPPRIIERAQPVVRALARFWQFKRKQLALELEGHLQEAQSQLDTLASANRDLTTQCTGQGNDINWLKLRNESLVEELQAQTGKLATTAAALEHETGKLHRAMQALAQAKVAIKDLEERQAQALTQIDGLEEDLANHQVQLTDQARQAGELQASLVTVRQQLAALDHQKQSLTNQCAERLAQIQALQVHAEKLSNQLQAQTVSVDALKEQEVASLARIDDLERCLVARQQALTETQQQLTAVQAIEKQLTEQCAGQATQISELTSYSAALTQQLHAEQNNAAELEARKAQALAQISELETYLEEHRTQLATNEQTIGVLENLTEQLKVSQQHLEDSYATINTQHLSLTEKFSLVSRILAQQPPLNEALEHFAALINHDYMDFASRESSLADEAQAVLDMQAILAEMRMLNNFPSIAGKTILSIAGGFSSGKSAFVNSFIHNREVQLATGINPVTVVPSYVVCAEETRIKGYSYNGGAIDLEPTLYASMSHEYVQAFGFDLRRILPFISVKVPMDPALFGNFCLIDTPGYNPGTAGGASAADRSTAASLVNQASALVWVIGLDPAGTIDQSDIEFIDSTPFRGQSLYIVLNKADVKSQEDLAKIMEQVADDLSYAGIEYAGMCAYSSMRKRDYPCSGMTFDEFLKSLNHPVDVVAKVTDKLDTVFDAYKQAIQADIAQLESRKGEFNAFKLDALEIGGTALFDRVDQAFPMSEQMFDSSTLEKLVNECDSLRDKLKKAARKALEASDVVPGHRSRH
jgi:hypothetical protein